MRLTRAEARQRSRAALIEAAITELAAKGYAAARLEDIAERAEVTTGSIYSIFGSKRQLLVAAVERLSDELVRDTADLEDPALSLDEVLRGIGSSWFRAATGSVARQQFAFELEMLGAALRDAAVGELLDEVVGVTNDERLTGLLVDRRIGDDPAARRTTEPQARRLAIAVAALMSGLAQRTLFLTDPLTEDDFVRPALALAAMIR